MECDWGNVYVGGSDAAVLTAFKMVEEASMILALAIRPTR